MYLRTKATERLTEMKDDKGILTWKGIQKKIAACNEDCQLIRTN